MHSKCKQAFFTSTEALSCPSVPNTEGETQPYAGEKKFFPPLSAQFPLSHMGIYILALLSGIEKMKMQSSVLQRFLKDSLLESSPNITTRAKQSLELLQIFLGMWLQWDFQLSWQDQIKIKAFLLLWQVHTIEPPKCEVYRSRKNVREALVAQILNLFLQEILVTTWSLFSKALQAHPVEFHHGITPGFNTPSAPLCIYTQPFTLVKFHLVSKLREKWANYDKKKKKFLWDSRQRRKLSIVELWTQNLHKNGIQNYILFLLQSFFSFS